MAHVSKRKALKELQCNLDRGEKIIATEEGTDAIIRWRRDTEVLMREVLSENSELYKGFHEIASFTSLTMVKQGVYLLGESIQQIEEYGLISERTQVHRLWRQLGIQFAVVVVTVVATVVATLFLPPVQRLLGITLGSNSELTEAQREMKCKELQVLFDNRLEEFDADSWASRDSLKTWLAANFSGRIPEIRWKKRAFAQRITMRRKNIVDSFMVAFQTYGCDTTSLRNR